MKTRTILPGTIPVKDWHQFMLGTVAPRPIAFVSTLDADGRPNLAPFSFFNAFSSNPPIVVFSANRRVSDNTTKHTLENLRTTGECVINSVSYAITRQMAVCSIDFPEGVSEFEKSGLTPIPSQFVKPFRVQESPAQMECRVREIITLGDQGGAGHLILCDVLCLHINAAVVNENGRIDPDKMDLMGRMGRAYYVRASGDAIHTIVQPYTVLTVGYDGLPESIRRSPVLNGNQIGLLSGMPELPGADARIAMKADPEVAALFSRGDTEGLHRLAASWLDAGRVAEGAAVLLLADEI
jgi:flavin reductase (DIM6/NTAB) family NADH-FMN oxidoreductase RutF